MLKRFANNELGESASRRVSYHSTADYAKSSKATCRVCERNIDQNELRLALMLQDEEGYKSTAWTHFNCFWKHPETKKLDGTYEIHNFSKLKPADQKKISAAFNELNAKKTTTKKRSKPDDDDSDDDNFSPKKKSSGKKLTKKKPVSNKRKRNVKDE